MDKDLRDKLGLGPDSLLNRVKEDLYNSPFPENGSRQDREIWLTGQFLNHSQKFQTEMEQRYPQKILRSEMLYAMSSCLAAEYISCAKRESDLQQLIDFAVKELVIKMATMATSAGNIQRMIRDKYNKDKDKR